MNSARFLGFAAAVGKAGTTVGTQVLPLFEARFSSTVKGQQAIDCIGAPLCAVGAAILMAMLPDRMGGLEEEIRGVEGVSRGKRMGHE
ncbi:hypothetical protein Q5752_003973 [Cryptotrichosporon argae]